MKKILYSILALSILSNSFAQNENHVIQLSKEHLRSYRHDPIMVFDNTFAENRFVKQETKPHLLDHAKMNYLEQVIGTTVYDLQTNNSIQNRIGIFEEQIHCGFTMSFQNANWTDRGTGYNKATDGSWQDNPTERLETVRVGWPNVLHTTNTEVIITHDGDGALRILRRALGSDDLWQEEEIPNPTGKTLLWPHATTGGLDGNSIHFVCITEPVAIQNDPNAVYQGMDGALLYYRSSDEGITWDIAAVQVPGLDSTAFNGFSADTYCIHSRSDKVVFAVFNDFGNTFAMVSDNNGESWIMRTIIDSPIDLYEIDSGIDLDSDGVADTLTNTDGSGHVFIDSELTSHIVFGEMRYMDADLTDGFYNYFPGWNGINYWREDFNEGDLPITITSAQDIDEDGVITLAQDGANIPNNGVGLAAYPSMGEDENGNLYLVFSSTVETHDNGDQNYRHIYVTKSEDGGENWANPPIDLTPDLDFDGFECTFPSLAPTVDDKLHILYQRDTEPGLLVSGDLDPGEDNDMVYYCITTDLIVIPTVYENFMQGELVVYPNPAKNEMNAVVKNMNGAQIEIVNALGQIVLTDAIDFDNIRIDISSLAAGIYTVNARLNSQLQTAQLIVE